MMPEGPKSCRLEDRVEYELPLGFIGSLLGGWFVDKKLRKLFPIGIMSQRKLSQSGTP
jgi:hypothetical protein